MWSVWKGGHRLRPVEWWALGCSSVLRVTLKLGRRCCKRVPGADRGPLKRTCGVRSSEIDQEAQMWSVCGNRLKSKLLAELSLGAPILVGHGILARCATLTSQPLGVPRAASAAHVGGWTN